VEVELLTDKLKLAKGEKIVNRALEFLKKFINNGLQILFNIIFIVNLFHLFFFILKIMNG
jgi:hypothetical protein